MSLTQRRLNLKRSTEDKLTLIKPPLSLDTRLPSLSSSKSAQSSKFSKELVGRFFVDGSFAAHGREQVREAKREAERKAKRRAKATQKRRNRVERELAKEAARIEAMERKLRCVPNDLRIHKRKRHLPRAGVLSPLDANARKDRTPKSFDTSPESCDQSLGMSTLASPQGWDQDDELSQSRSGSDSAHSAWGGSISFAVEKDEDISDTSNENDDKYKGSHDGKSPFWAAGVEAEQTSNDWHDEQDLNNIHMEGDSISFLDKMPAVGKDITSKSLGLEDEQQTEDGQGVFDGQGNWYGDLGSYLREQNFASQADGQTEPMGLDGVEPLEHITQYHSDAVLFGNEASDRDSPPFEDNMNNESSPASYDVAAQTIQAIVRGNIGRQRAMIRRRRQLEKIRRKQAAISIQSMFRRRRDRRMIEASAVQKDCLARKLQSVVRGVVDRRKCACLRQKLILRTFAVVKLQSWRRGLMDRQRVHQIRASGALIRSKATAALSLQVRLSYFTFFLCSTDLAYISRVFVHLLAFNFQSNTCLLFWVLEGSTRTLRKAASISGARI